jgi:hypothetical protein
MAYYIKFKKIKYSKQNQIIFATVLWIRNSWINDTDPGGQLIIALDPYPTWSLLWPVKKHVVK